MRTCTRCHLSKPVEQFSRSTAAADGYHTWCKACKSARTRQWYAENQQQRRAIDRADYAADGSRQRAQAKKWHSENRSRSLASKRAWKLGRYGLTPADYERLLQAQGGRCAICREKPSTRRQHDLVVDHCHVKQQVRGLLCHRCNVGLGHFEDSTELLFAAVNYLRNEVRKTA